MILPNSLLKQNNPIVIAIDGKCGAGKTTFSNLLQKQLEKNNYLCNVIHIDDFFLPLKLRTKNRLEEPGGNIDYTRFLEEVLLPLKKLNSNSISKFSYYPFECSHMTFSSIPITITQKPITIIEGVYSMRPEFRSFYDFTIFMTISDKLQKERIIDRNGKEMFHMFESKWIPMENKYFDFYNIPQACHQILDGDSSLIQI